MKTKLIRIADIAELTGLSTSTIKNYVNGGYYSKGKFVPKPVDFPQPVKVIRNTKLFEEIAVRRFFNLA